MILAAPPFFLIKKVSPFSDLPVSALLMEPFLSIARFLVGRLSRQSFNCPESVRCEAVERREGDESESAFRASFDFGEQPLFCLPPFQATIARLTEGHANTMV